MTIDFQRARDASLDITRTLIDRMKDGPANADISSVMWESGIVSGQPEKELVRSYEIARIVSRCSILSLLETPMLKCLALLTVLAFGGVMVAHADQISGFVNANGTDSFTSSTITFGPASVQGALGGSFAAYLTDGNPVVFLSGALPYSTGAHAAPPGLPPLFTINGAAETFAFNIASYTADYFASAMHVTGCSDGSTCLLVTGLGSFTGSGTHTFDATPGSFTFTSQYALGQTVGTLTTFSSSASTTPSAVPEPASLALFGTGLLGLVGLGRRKLFNT